MHNSAIQYFIDFLFFHSKIQKKRIAKQQKVSDQQTLTQMEGSNQATDGSADTVRICYQVFNCYTYIDCCPTLDKYHNNYCLASHKNDLTKRINKN